jgi:hypothetical protein
MAMPNFPWLYCTRAYGTANHLLAIAKPAVAHATPLSYESIQVQPQTDLSMNNAKKQGHQTFYTWHDWVHLALHAASYSTATLSIHDQCASQCSVSAAQQSNGVFTSLVAISLTIRITYLPHPFPSSEIFFLFFLFFFTFLFF